MRTSMAPTRNTAVRRPARAPSDDAIDVLVALGQVAGMRADQPVSIADFKRIISEDRKFSYLRPGVDLERCLRELYGTFVMALEIDGIKEYLLNDIGAMAYGRLKADRRYDPLS